MVAFEIASDFERQLPAKGGPEFGRPIRARAQRIFAPRRIHPYAAISALPKAMTRAPNSR